MTWSSRLLTGQHTTLCFTPYSPITLTLVILFVVSASVLKIVVAHDVSVLSGRHSLHTIMLSLRHVEWLLAWALCLRCAATHCWVTVHRLPELRQLKSKLQYHSDDRFSVVFMTGSGSTMVGVGSDKAPLWMQHSIHYEDVFCSPARLIARQPGEWYQPSHQQSDLVAA